MGLQRRLDPAGGDAMGAKGAGDTPTSALEVEDSRMRRRRWASTAQVIVPLLCDFGLDRPFVARYRRELLAHASGTILEIGFGTGLNLPYYPAHVRKVTTVDPNVGMYRRARRRIKQAGIEVDQRVLGGERLPFEDGTFDCVVSTFTLCSIEEVAQALREVYRVLLPRHGAGWRRPLLSSLPR